MEGSIDLSFESVEGMKQLPSTEGSGWLASDLSQDDWTVKLNHKALEEIALMVNQLKRNPLPTLLLRPEQFEILGYPVRIKKPKTFVIWGRALLL